MLWHEYGIVCICRSQYKYLPSHFLIPGKPKKFSFTLERDPQTVRLNCSVTEVYPEPALKLFQGEHLLPLSEHMSIVNKDDYSLSVSHVISQRSISDTSVLGCSLTLQGTNFSLTEEEVFRKYSPRSLPIMYNSAVMHHQCALKCSWVFFPLFLNPMTMLIRN